MSALDDPVTRRLRHFALATSGLAAAIALWPRAAASERKVAAVPALEASRPPGTPQDGPIATPHAVAASAPVATPPAVPAAAPAVPAAAPAVPAASPVVPPPAVPAATPAGPPAAPASPPSPARSPERARPPRTPPPSASPAPRTPPPSAAARTEAPDPTAALLRALAARGLSLNDVSAMPDARAELERFQRQPSPERLPELLSALDAAEIPTALIRQKLDRLGEKLRRAAPRLSPPALELAERGYLDLETTAQSNPSRAERHALLAAAARLSARLE